MRRDHVSLWSPDLEASRDVIAYGHFGRPVVVFPSEGGRAWDYENNGMVDAVAPLIDSGRVKLYCIDSFDAASWSASHLTLEERARQHDRYEGRRSEQLEGLGRRSCRIGAVEVHGMNLGRASIPDKVLLELQLPGHRVKHRAYGAVGHW